MLSIAIGKTNILLVEGERTSFGIQIRKCAKSDFSEDVLDDGFVKKRLELSTFIQKMIRQGGFTENQVTYIIDSGSILFRRLELPNAEADIPRMARNEIRQVVSSPDEYVYDCSIHSQNVGEKVCPVWAYAVPKEMLEGYLQLAQDMHQRLRAVDLLTNSLEKLLLLASVNAEGPEQARVFVQIEADGLSVHLFADGERAFSRFVPVTVQEMMILLESHAGNVGGDSFKNQINKVLADPHIDSIVDRAFKNYTNRLVEELQKINLFQRRRNADNPVTAFFLFGDLARLYGLADILTDALGLPTEVIYSISNVQIPKDCDVSEYLCGFGSFIQTERNDWRKILTRPLERVTVKRK
ncbi:hypothetical protein [Ethanoligenens sp.]|uniref:hypothetical protein n=1 Tax=Ethanoligenens sp. TaxID=2099655 RepID=UPI0039EC4D53